MYQNIIINVKDNEEIKKFKDIGIVNFLLPIKDYCVGYDDILLSNIDLTQANMYLLINRILNKEDIQNLKKMLPSLKNIKGIFFEDLGVYNVVKELKLNFEMIYFPNHFATNHRYVNAALNMGIDSVVLSNEITYEEISEILKKVNDKVVLQVFGYNQIMYSRRNLITNFNKEYNLDVKKDSTIIEQVTKTPLRVRENEYGTVVYDSDAYNNLKLLEFDNIKLFYINKTYFNVEQIIDVLKSGYETNSGFLNKKTVYKVGDLREK